MTTLPLLRTGTIVMLGHCAVALVGIVALRAFTELAPPEVFGEANLVLGALAWGVQIFLAPLTAAQLRYHSEADARGAGNQFTRETLIWTLRGCLALAVATVLLLLFWRSYAAPMLSLLLLPAAGLWLFATGLRNAFLSRLHAERRQVTYIGLQVIEAVLLAVFTVGALHFAATTQSYVLAQGLAMFAIVAIVFCVAPCPRVLVASRSTGDAGFLARAVKYGSPFAPMALFAWVGNLAERYVLAFLLGAGAAGQYVAPYIIASKGMALTNAGLNDLFRPLLFDAANRRDRGDAQRLLTTWLSASILIGACAVLVIAFAGHWIAGLLLADEYRGGSVNIMIWAAAACGTLGVAQVLETGLMALGRSSSLLVPSALGAASNLVFCAMLIPMHGVLGAAQASCGGFVVRLIATAVTLHASLRRHPVLAS
jgi:O-antigen/teichoic acid export membrane protein